MGNKSHRLSDLHGRNRTKTSRGAQCPPLSRTYELGENSREQDRAPVFVPLCYGEAEQPRNEALFLLGSKQVRDCAHVAHSGVRSKSALLGSEVGDLGRRDTVGRVNKEQDCKRQAERRAGGRWSDRDRAPPLSPWRGSVSSGSMRAPGFLSWICCYVCHFGPAFFVCILAQSDARSLFSQSNKKKRRILPPTKSQSILRSTSRSRLYAHRG
jgi:hypothetical protein